MDLTFVGKRSDHTSVLSCFRLSICPSVWTFSWDYIISFFTNFGVVLETHMKLCVTERDFFCAQHETHIWENFSSWDIKLYGPFLWMGFNCLKATEPFQGGGLLFTTKFPDSPDTHLIDFGRMKDWFDLGATQWFWTQNPWIGNPSPKMPSSNQIAKFFNQPYLQGKSLKYPDILHVDTNSNELKVDRNIFCGHD